MRAAAGPASIGKAIASIMATIKDKSHQPTTKARMVGSEAS
jgi:hypothetical protein